MAGPEEPLVPGIELGDRLGLTPEDLDDRVAGVHLLDVAVEEAGPLPLGGELPLVKKEEVHDFIPDLKALNGYVVDKLEGFAFDASGKAYAVTVNDGVDDSSGETLFFPVDIKGTN